MSSTGKTPFKKQLKDTLEGVAWLFGIGAAIGILLLFTIENTAVAFGITFWCGMPACLFGWLSSLIKPKKGNWVAGGEYEDWS